MPDEELKLPRVLGQGEARDQNVEKKATTKLYCHCLLIETFAQRVQHSRLAETAIVAFDRAENVDAKTSSTQGALCFSQSLPRPPANTPVSIGLERMKQVPKVLREDPPIGKHFALCL